MRFVTLNCFVNVEATAIEKITINVAHIVAWRALDKNVTGVMTTTGLEYTANHSKHAVTDMIKLAEAPYPGYKKKEKQEKSEVNDELSR